MSVQEKPHRRHNPLLDEWILVSPHRLKRPWQGATEDTAPDTRPAHDPDCYLCPGNRRANGRQNPVYTDTFVFDNDFAALLDEPLDDAPAEDPLLRWEPVRGICRVLCFSPRHDLTLAHMDDTAIRRVVDLWIQQTTDLFDKPSIRSVQIFENKGAMMGCSNPHPHGQVWATSAIPTEIAREDASQRAWHAEHGRTLLADYARREQAAAERLVLTAPGWMALVPWWARWPFETLLIPERPVARLTELRDTEADGLARIVGQLTRLYDRLFNTSFPYTMGIHQAPAGSESAGHWHLHLHFYPPLLRSATVRKFMVGFEMLAEPQRDLTPEAAAARLRQMHREAPS